MKNVGCYKDENLDDVKGTHLVNAMKNMDIGDIRPREVIDVEDDIKCSLTQMCKLVVLMIKIKLVQVMTKCKINKWLVHHLNQVSNQVQVLQPTNVARDHPLDSIIGDISRGVQTRS